MYAVKTKNQLSIEQQLQLREYALEMVKQGFRTQAICDALKSSKIPYHIGVVAATVNSYIHSL